MALMKVKFSKYDVMHFYLSLNICARQEKSFTEALPLFKGCIKGAFCLGDVSMLYFISKRHC